MRIPREMKHMTREHEEFTESNGEETQEMIHLHLEQDSKSLGDLVLPCNCACSSHKACFEDDHTQTNQS